MAPTAAHPLDTNKATGCSPGLWLLCDLWWATQASDFYTDPKCGRTRSLAAVVSGHHHCPRWQHRPLDCHGPRDRVALRHGHQYGPKWQPQPLASTWPSITTEAVNINTDPVCRHCPQLQLWPRRHHGPGWQHGPLRSVWPQLQHCLQIPTRPKVAVQIPGFYVAFGGHLTQAMDGIGPWT